MTEERDTAIEYWRKRLPASIPALALASDFPRRGRSGITMRSATRSLEAALSAALLGRMADGNDDLLATYAILLQRLTGNADIAIGVPNPASAKVLPMLFRIDPEAATFEAVLAEVAVQRRLAKRYAEIAPETALAFALAGPEGDAVSFGRTAARFEQACALDGNDEFEIALMPAVIDGLVELRCVFDGDLFETASISRWLAAMETLLAAALANPDAAVATLPWVSEAALAELCALQPAPTPRRHGELITDLVWAQARSTPDRIAIRSEETCWTYAELVRRAQAIARELRARGADAGDLIGICLGRNPGMLAAALGVLRAGAAYVPLDPAYPRDRLEYMADDADLHLLLCETSTSGLLSWPEERTLAIDRLDLDALDAITRSDAGWPVSAESPAYVIYTSGSTGKPKGVSVPHRAVVNFLYSMGREPGLHADDRLLAVTTLSFDIAVLELFLPLTKGAEIVLASREQSMDGRELCALLDRHGVTVMQATPSTWRLLVESGWEPPRRFRSLCGGEALPTDLVRALTLNDAELWNMYGPTETTVWSTCQRIDPADREISIGRPIDNTTVWILDPFLNPCPMRVPGEIWIGGAGVTLGYLGRPELTAERFIADEFSRNPGLLYRTGDRGRWRNDGRLEHLGRLDFQVKVRGYRIELGEIESSLVTFAGVSRAVVTTREDRPGDVRIVAYLVMSSGHTLDPAALRRHLRAGLPEYMIPQHFVGLASIPLLPNGKIDRKSVPTPRQEPIRTADPEQARNGTERRVAEIFAQVLEVDAVGIRDNFFAVGGHSLLAAKLAGRLGREFDIDLPMHSIFEAPDVAARSARISTAVRESGRAAPRVAHAVRNSAPATIMQERLWIHDQLNPASAAYNIPVAYRLGGAVDPVALAAAFSKVVERHASLRTSLQQGPDGLVQKILAPEPVRFEIEDLSKLQPDVRETALIRRFAELSGMPIDTGGSRTFHARLFRLSGTDWVLFFLFHHAFWDGGSTERLSREMADLLRPADRSPAALSLDYPDFAIWHRQQLSSERFALRKTERIETWRRRFEAYGIPTRLPSERPRVQAARRTRGVAEFSLSTGATAQLRSFASEHATTMYAVVLAALQIVLCRFSGERHPIVSSPVRLVEDPGLESVLGMFTSILPIAIDIDRGADFSAVLEQTRRSIIDGLSSPHLQLDDILRESSMRPYAGPQTPYLAQFSFEDVRGRPETWGDAQVRHIPLLAPEPTDDLMIWVFEHEDRLEGYVLYDASLLDDAMVAELLRMYADLLGALPGAGEHPALQLMRSDSPAGHAAPAPTIASGTGSTPESEIASIPSGNGELAPSERMLADIWQDLLGIGDIASDANFFDIGGHSLLAMTMIARVEKKSGVRLNLLKVANGSLRTLAMDLPSTPPASNQTLADRIRRLFGSKDKGGSS
jgi:amino acid adenylation domain-containing protein